MLSLNLTAASYVHLVEPQWNPMVEAQAAARVDRLDQTKDIVIIRYVVEDSIEQVYSARKASHETILKLTYSVQRIRARQRNKILLAELSVAQMSTDPVVEDIVSEIKANNLLGNDMACADRTTGPRKFIMKKHARNFSYPAVPSTMHKHNHGEVTAFPHGVLNTCWVGIR